MAMTLSTWSFETASCLHGLGVDCEKVRRFDNLQNEGDHPLPFVFSKKEVLHNRSLENPAQGFCMCFCCKEAVFKAIGEPYNFSECEIFPVLEKEHTFSPIEISMSTALRNQCGVDRGLCLWDINNVDEQEMVTVVYLFRER
jgi:phosphopantetheinyl transferase (holo-ACP synthase)